MEEAAGPAVAHNPGFARQPDHVRRQSRGHPGAGESEILTAEVFRNDRLSVDVVFDEVGEELSRQMTATVEQPPPVATVHRLAHDIARGVEIEHSLHGQREGEAEIGRASWR